MKDVPRKLKAVGRKMKVLASMGDGKKRSKPLAVDWTELPAELLQEIAMKLENNCNIIRFRSVCRSWRIASVQPRLPCPILVFQKDWNSSRIDLYDALNYRCYGYEAPEIHGKWVYGSSHGWLVILDPVYKSSLGHAVTLFNPITTSKIMLPRLPKNLLLSVFSRVLLCFNPGSTVQLRHHQLLIAIWLNKKLVLLREGDDSWVVIGTPIFPQFGDIAYFEKKLYAIDGRGKLSVLDGESSPMLLQPLSNIIPPIFSCISYNLTESAGMLWLIAKNSTKFYIYKLDKIERVLQWKPAADEGIIWIVSSRQSFFVSASGDAPLGKRNQIYFLNDNRGHPFSQSSYREELDTEFKILEVQDGVSTFRED